MGPATPLRVNGRPRRLRAGTVADLLAELGYDRQAPGIAVAVNGEVVPRAVWSAAEVAAGDEVEIVGAAQGG